MAVKIVMAYGSNPRIQPLRDGTVKPENIDLEFITIDGGMIQYRNLAYDEFDASEMSISETLLAIERREALGNGKWDWSAIPVYPARAFAWRNLYVNVDSGIESLEDLRGKRIATPDYDMTAALWMRCALKDLYGIEAWDNVWYNGRSKELSHGGALGLHLPGWEVVKGVEHHWLTADRTMDVMLDRGEIDAATLMFSGGPVTAGDPTVIDRYGGTPIEGNPRIRQLLPDGGRAVSAEYYQRFGLYPANHHVIVQNRILREHPWVAQELCNAFRKSTGVAYERARQAQSAYLLHEGNDFREQAAVFGEDPYPVGLSQMGKNVERAIQGSLDSGLIREPLRLEDVYYHTILDY